MARAGVGGIVLLGPNVASGDQVAAIFLGQAGRFPDGAEAVALDHRLGSTERNQFYTQVTGKTPALIQPFALERFSTSELRRALARGIAGGLAFELVQFG